MSLPVEVLCPLDGDDDLTHFLDRQLRSYADQGSAVFWREVQSTCIST